MILYMGLGRMGLPMAGHALRSGQDMVGYDPFPERREMFAAMGGRTASEPDAAMPQAEALVVMVGAEAQVDAIAAQAFQACRPGTLVLVVSTVSPGYVADLDERARARRLRVVDAPVCRAEMGAVQGTLLAFLAGAQDDCAAAAALMRPYSSDIEVVGARPGAAQVAKTVNNMILWACAMANEEGLRLAESWQLDPLALRRALVTSSADNWCLRHWDRLREMPWSIKDMEIALDTARQARLAVPLGEQVSHLVNRSSVLTHAR